MLIGILALQGDFQKHKKIIDNFGLQNMLIRNAEDLNKCHALIIPGGESTAISQLIDNNKLRIALQCFANEKPIFGTCAGMIMLSCSKPTKNMSSLNVMNFQVDRNAWGRQVDSFSTKIKLDFNKSKRFHAVFIRAPKVSDINNNIQVLASYNNEPVLLTDGTHLAASFHPEIGNDSRIHEYFIKKINEKIPAFS